MPFIQRLVEPINIAQTVWSGHGSFNDANFKQLQCESCKCQNNQYEIFTHNCDDHFTSNSSNISCQIYDATYYEPNIASSSCNENNNNNNNHRSDSINEVKVTINDENVVAPLSPMKKLKQHIEFSSTGSPSQRHIYTRVAAANVSSNAFDTSLSDAYWPKTSTRLYSYSSSVIDRKKSAFEFDSITNITLSNTLRQLASLVLIASDIFDDLQKELQSVGDRACEVQHKILTMERRIKIFDPKMVKIPEGDLLIFAQCKVHYKCNKSCNNQLFTVDTRPLSVRVLYEKAESTYSSSISKYQKSGCIKCKSNVNTEVATITIKNKDSITNGNRKKSTTIDTEIEIRLPATFEDLRKWTSSEALGDVTVTPDCMHYVNSFLNTSSIMTDNIEDHTSYVKPTLFTSHDLNDDILLPDTINANVPLNHRLPSPEEQCKTIALKYPAEIVPVDVSGKGFRRMCSMRATVLRPFTFLTAPLPKENNCQTELQTIKRRARSFKGKTKRRNTIAGTDQKELCVAANSSRLIDDKNVDLEQSLEKQSKKLGRSKSSDILKKDGVAFPYDKGKNTLTRFNALKQWGRNRFKLIQRSTTDGDAPSTVILVDNDDSAKMEKSQSKGDKECTSNTILEQHKNVNLLLKEAKKSILKSPSKNVTICQNVDMPGKQHLNVQLRDTTCLNRLRHNVFLNSCNEDQPHSSSGNWSASSESGRTSIGSEITPIPKSSASNTSLNAFNNCQNASGTPFLIFTRRKFLNTSTSNSVTSESTLTPELAAVTASENISNQLNDDETSSAYSCDTEGYYTSFHMDSGLRTLKEEDVPIVNIQSDDKEQNTHLVNRLINRNTRKSNLELTFVGENDYELFGHGSTSTTTSSAGTVCTTLRIKNNTNTDKQNMVKSVTEPNDELTLTDKANSTNNTVEKRDKIILGKDEPLEYNNKITLNLCNQQISSADSSKHNEVEYSGSSDLESVERVERIKQKTIIRSKHIPSMCIITPSTSDDETESEQNNNDNNSNPENNNSINKINSTKSNNLRKDFQEQIENKGEFNKIETTYNSHNENKKEHSKNNIQSSENKILKKLNKQQKPSRDECVNVLNSMLYKKTVIHENFNSETVSSKSLDIFSFEHTPQPTPSTICSLTKTNTHVLVNTPDTLKNNKKTSHSWEKCCENENESIESELSLDSESNHLNLEGLHNNSGRINIGNEKIHNSTNFKLNKSLLSSQNNNEMYENPCTTSDLDQKKLLVKNNNELICQQKQTQLQHSKSLAKDVIYSTPIKSTDDSRSNDPIFSRARPTYWTLQSKKYIKNHPIAPTRLSSRDDTYATFSKSEANSRIENSGSYSPKVRSKYDAFSTLSANHSFGNQACTANFNAERFNTCADRTGKAKTSLMDFKKLLLAKSVQTSVLPKKMSAVELLKKNPTIIPVTTISNDSNSTDINTKQTTSQIERNLKLLQLSGSPKKFANRRMLRQGQFGLPSQSLSSKSSSPKVWNNSLRTDIISTIIPEVHGEIDQNVHTDLECINSDKMSESSGGNNHKTNEINGTNNNVNVIQVAVKPITIPTLETAL